MNSFVSLLTFLNSAVILWLVLYIFPFFIPSPALGEFELNRFQIFNFNSVVLKFILVNVKGI